MDEQRISAKTKWNFQKKTNISEMKNVLGGLNEFIDSIKIVCILKI